ncbi:MAG: ATP-dependent Clp protease adaptor ClpS [Planctomycetota bacterium]
MEAGNVSILTIPDSDLTTKKKRQPRYNVILLDDNDHTYDYVIRMLVKLFGFTEEKSYQFACEVDSQGRVIVMTTTREHAELKQIRFIPSELIP